MKSILSSQKLKRGGSWFNTYKIPICLEEKNLSQNIDELWKWVEEDSKLPYNRVMVVKDNLTIVSNAPIYIFITGEQVKCSLKAKTGDESCDLTLKEKLLIVNGDITKHYTLTFSYSCPTSLAITFFLE